MSQLPIPSTAEAIADWVEIEALFSRRSSISKSELLDLINEDGMQGELNEYDDSLLADEDDDYWGPGSADEELVSEADILVDDVLERLAERSEMGGAGYPFFVDQAVVERSVESWRDSPAYSFLTALNARAVHGLHADIHLGAKLFEMLSTEAVGRYWGGESVRFGWPRDEGDPKHFSEAARKLVVGQLGERINRSLEEFPQRTKDLGVDVVAWRPLDRRRGQSVLLCQCSIGNDWDAKGLHIDTWRAFVTFAVPPMKGLAFPFVPDAVKSEMDWEIVCGMIGLPFDRLRLIRLLGDVSLGPSFEHDLIAWTDGLATLLES